MRHRALALAVGLTMGATFGWFLAQRHMRKHQQDLFSPKPWRRLAALGAIAADGGIDTVRLLRDYMEWESQPVLRRRAEGVLRRLEAALG